MARRPKGEGSIYRRSDGRWVGRLPYVDPVTGLLKRAHVTGPTKSAVNNQLKEMRRRIDDGSVGRDDPMTFGAFAERWIASSLESSDRKRSTKVLYAGLARTHIITGELGKTRLSALKPTTVERFIGELRQKGLASSSIRQIYTVARAIGDAAVRDGLVGTNAFVRVRRPQVVRTEAGYLTPDQVADLLAAAATSRYRSLFEFLVMTGLRRGEALGLRWDDVDLEARIMRVQGTLARLDGTLQVTAPKSARSRRSIPLSSPAVTVLRDVRKRTDRERQLACQLWQDTGFVFVTDIGEPCDPRNALRALHAAAARAGLPGVGLHTLRHSAASVMLTHGVPLTVVSQILGHSGIAITADVYGHVAPEVSRAALDVLADALGDASAPPVTPAAPDVPETPTDP